MADWTTIPDSSIEPGKPIRSIDGLALRDNPVAIAEGAAGAPKIQNQAFSDRTISQEKLQLTTNELTWIRVLLAQSVVGDVGTYAFLGETETTSTTPGSTRAGSSLRYAGIQKTGTSWISARTTLTATGINTAPAGTWKCMGQSVGAFDDGQSYYPATLWLRIA